MTHDGNEIVEIYRAKNLIEAHAIRLKMEQEGIPVSIANENLQGIVGEIAMGWSTSPKLMVKRDDANRARTLIDQLTAARSSQGDEELACFECGSPMGSGTVCPKCGWSYGEVEPPQ